MTKNRLRPPFHQKAKKFQGPLLSTFFFFKGQRKRKVTIKISGQLFPNWRESLAVSTPMGVEFHEPYFFWIVDVDGQVGVDKLDHWIFRTIERNQLCCIHTGKSNDKKIKWQVTYKSPITEIVFVSKARIPKCKRFYVALCLKITEKSRIQNCERSELRLHFEWRKVSQKCQKWSIFANL